MFKVKIKGKKTVVILLGLAGLIVLLAAVILLKGKFQGLPEGGKPEVGQLAPEAVFFDVNGKSYKLSQFKGKRVMLWFLATWCPSCSMGASILSQNKKDLSGLQIIALQTYGNAGFPGRNIKEFAQKFAPSTLKLKNWFWGKASQKASQIYNPKNYPDIYYLIDEKGVVRSISSAPAGTLKDIIDFANGKINSR